MAISSYPYGFTGGTTIRNMPILNCYSGNVYWVDNTTGSGGSDGNPGTFQAPLATIDGAINRCIANHGDVIMVKAGHVETLTTASEIAMDVAGVEIIGMGVGDARPIINLNPGTVTFSCFNITAQNCSVRNIVFIPKKDGLVHSVAASADYTVLDITWIDSNAWEGANAIYMNGARSTLNLTYYGTNAGTCDSVVDVYSTGSTGGHIDLNINFTGSVNNYVVNFITNYTRYVNITGSMYIDGDTTGAKVFGGNYAGLTTFSVDVFAGAAGGRVTAPTTPLTGVPNTVFNSSSAVFDPLMKTATYTCASAATFLTLANSPRTMFTVSGPIIFRLVGYVPTTMTSTAAAGTLSVGIAGATTSIIGASGVDGTNFQAGHTWVNNVSTAAAQPLLNQVVSTWHTAYSPTSLDIILTVGTADMTAGALNVVMQYYKLSSSTTVTATAG
jgi:hypothetical protein